MKTKPTIIRVVAGSTIILLFLAVVLFRSSADNMSFQFLDQCEPTDHTSSRSAHGYRGESLKYRLVADYDTFTKAAKSELSAKGFEDISAINGMGPNRLLYARGSFEHLSVWITYSVLRKDPNDKTPIYSSINVEIMRHTPGNIKSFWVDIKSWWWKVRHRGNP